MISHAFYFKDKAFIVIIILFCASGVVFSQKDVLSPIPAESRQMVLVITDSAKAVKGFLYFFEKSDKNTAWKQTAKNWAVVLGKNGLGWGQGLHPIDTTKLPFKKEGDGRSPAGIFSLGAAFGYSPPEKMTGLKIPYLPITEMLECIDDIESRYYNKIILRDKADTVDWNSSEKMNHVGVWYELGVVVNHNTNAHLKGYGSCIFLHNWANPNETSSGCTEMDPGNMKELLYKLNSDKYPVLIQLTKPLFELYKAEWKLPEIILSVP